MNPVETVSNWYFSDVLVITTGGTAVIGLIFLLSLARCMIGEKKKDREHTYWESKKQQMQKSERRRLLSGHVEGLSYI